MPDDAESLGDTLTPLKRHTTRPSNLTVVYDGECLLCRRSVQWLNRQRPAVPIRAIPALSDEALERFGHLPDYGDNMIVAADDGRLWVGPPEAYLVVMWALPMLRPLSYLLSIKALRPAVGRVFQLVTGNRRAIGGLLGEGCRHCVVSSTGD